MYDIDTELTAGWKLIFVCEGPAFISMDGIAPHKTIGKESTPQILREKENKYTSWENTEKYKKEKE